jgi:hypothetical protein
MVVETAVHKKARETNFQNYQIDTFKFQSRVDRVDRRYRSEFIYSRKDLNVVGKRMLADASSQRHHGRVVMFGLIPS